MNRPPSPAGGEPVHNRDIFGGAGPELEPITSLVENARIGEAFACYEAEANRLKTLYVRLGRLSAYAIGASAVYGAYRMAWSGPAWLPRLDILVAVVGGVGILLDVFVRRKNFKLRWLANRFGAERVRSVKFQLYALAAQARSREELDKVIAEMTAVRLARIADELNLPIGALNTFHGPSALDLPRLSGTGQRRGAESAELLRCAIADFRARRVRYQHVFAEQMGRDIAEQQRGYSSAGDALFVLGAVLLVAGIMMRGSADLVTIVNYLEATGLAFFVLSATSAVLSGGGGHLASNSRYQQYSRDLARILDVEPGSAGEFIDLIERMELLALRELDDFWRDMWISSYRA